MGRVISSIDVPKKLNEMWKDLAHTMDVSFPLPSLPLLQEIGELTPNCPQGGLEGDGQAHWPGLQAAGVLLQGVPPLGEGFLPST